jgi:hypothetical protein
VVFSRVSFIFTATIIQVHIANDEVNSGPVVENMRRSAGIAAFVLELDTEIMCMVSFTP